jgi:hypothetical protein
MCKDQFFFHAKTQREPRRKVSFTFAPVESTIELLCFFCFASVAVPCVPYDTKNCLHKSGNARNRNGRKVLLSET